MKQCKPAFKLHPKFSLQDPFGSAQTFNCWKTQVYSPNWSFHCALRVNRYSRHTPHITAPAESPSVPAAGQAHKV